MQVQTCLRLWFCHHAQPFPFDMADGWGSQTGRCANGFFEVHRPTILKVMKIRKIKITERIAGQRKGQEVQGVRTESVGGSIMDTTLVRI